MYHDFMSLCYNLYIIYKNRKTWGYIMDITTVLIEYKSIIGTLLGSITTLIITYLIRYNGGIKFSIQNWNIKFYRNEDSAYHEETIVKDVNEAKHVYYEFDIYIYNGSEIPKSLKDFSIEFVCNKNIVIEKLYDCATTKFVSMTYISEFLKVANIPPKQINLYKVKGWLDNENIEKLAAQKNNKMDIKFLAYNHKGRSIRKHIITINLKNL
jgi:hypothetical protein